MSTSSTSSPSKSSSTSRIAVDLSHKTTRNALQSLSQMTKRMSKIKSAHLYTSRAGVGIHPSISPLDVVTIFDILGQMPNLNSVVVDLNRPHHYSGNGGLPLQALTKLLQTSRNLQSLQLFQLDVTLMTSITSLANASWKDLGRYLHKSKQLHKISVVSCVGQNVKSLVEVIAKHARALRQFQLTGSSASSHALARLTSQTHHPHLHKLELEDLPDISDDQVTRLCQDLERPQCTLQELHIRSSVLTEEAGFRLAEMLCLNTSLQTLVLHLDCESLGNGMAQCFQVNRTLGDVDVRCYGDDEAVSQSVCLMAQALQQSSIQKLRLCLEIEPFEHQQEIVQAFATMLKADTNTCLQELVLDDGIQNYPLGEELQLQLELNQCGYSRFVREEEDITPQQWMEALELAAAPANATDNASSTDNTLNVLYTILSNCPWLICDALNDREDVKSTPAPAPVPQPLMDNSSKKMDSSSKRRRFPIRRNKSKDDPSSKSITSPTTPRREKQLPVRTASGLKKMVRSLLASAA